MGQRAKAGTWGRLWRDLTAAPEFYRERRSHPLELTLAVAEPVLAVVLATTLAAGVGAFLAALLPLWTLTGLTPLAAATAAVGYFYGRRLQWSGLIWREWAVLLAPFLLIWRGLTLLTLSAPLSETLTLWLHHPSAVFDGPFVGGSAVLLLAWVQGLGYGRDLAALHPEVTPWVRPEPGSRAYWEEDARRRVQLLPPPSAVAGRWLSGGIALTVLAALGAAGVRQTLTPEALVRLVSFGGPSESSALPDVLLYMLCGLILVGLAQGSRLRANWAADAVAIMPGMSRRTLTALLGLVGLALLVALLLPTQYAVGVGDLLATAISYLAYIAELIGVLIATLVALLLSPLLGLLGHHLGHTPPPAVAPPPQRLTATHGGAGELIKTLVFWGMALSVTLYCVVMVLRQAEGRLPALALVRRWGRRLWQALRAVVAALLRPLKRGAALLTALVQRLVEEHPLSRPSLQRPSLRGAGPRTLVAYMYLSIEERARRLGLPRRKGQTATEYSAMLRAARPDLDPDLDRLTTLFQEARYSPHPFGDEQSREARTVWRRARARLRALQHRPEESER